MKKLMIFATLMLLLFSASACDRFRELNPGPTMHTITVNANIDFEYTLSPGGEVADGEEATLTLDSHEDGYEFVHWYENTAETVLSGDLSTTFTVERSMAIEAVFRVADDNDNDNNDNGDNDNGDNDNGDNGNDDNGNGQAPLETLTIHYIDVGQADATFIEGPNYNILIDAGRTFWSSQNNTIPYLENLGIERIDLVIGTHPHMDHIGDIDVVLDTFEVGLVWKSGYVHDTATYTRVRTAIDNAVDAGEIEYDEPRFGDALTLGQKELKVLNPAPDFGGIHDASISLILSYGDVRFMFTGDAEQTQENNMINRASDKGWSLDVDVYQAGHHGSSTSSTLPFMEAMTPSTTIYSAGEGNSHGHPHQEFLDNVAAVNSALYGTDVNGNITVTSNGLVYEVSVERGEAIMVHAPIVPGYDHEIARLLIEPDKRFAFA